FTTGHDRHAAWQGVLRALKTSGLVAGDTMTPAILVLPISATKGIAQRLTQRPGLRPGILRIDEAEHATRTKVALLRVDATIDVLQADPARRLDPVKDLDGHRLVIEVDQRAGHELAQQVKDLRQVLLAGCRKPPAPLE